MCDVSFIISDFFLLENQNVKASVGLGAASRKLSVSTNSDLLNRFLEGKYCGIIEQFLLIICPWFDYFPFCILFTRNFEGKGKCRFAQIPSLNLLSLFRCFGLYFTFKVQFCSWKKGIENIFKADYKSCLKLKIILVLSFFRYWWVQDSKWALWAQVCELRRKLLLYVQERLQTGTGWEKV